MNKFLTKSMVLLLALLLCLGVIGCHPTTQNGEDTTEGTTQTVVEREPIVLDYEGDLTPGGTPEIRAEYGDSVYVGKAVPAFYYTEEQAIALLEQIEELYDLFENGTPESFVNAFYSVKSGAFAELTTQCRLAWLEYDMYRNDPEADENYLWMNALFGDAAIKLNKLYRLAYGTPAGDLLFKGWSEQSIRIALARADGADDELRELLRKHEELTVQYYEVTDGEDGMDAMVPLYMEFVRVNNAMAQKMGYDNYLDYAYECDYRREYSPEKIEQVRKLTKEQLAPLQERVREELLALDEIMQDEEFAAADALYYLEYDNEAVDAYIQSVSASFGNAYTELWEKEYYCLAYDESASKISAYQEMLPSLKHPFLYIGPGYTDAQAIVHEYGHYYSALIAPDREISYDLAELQSQGNEWLLLAHLSEQYHDNAILHVNLERLYTALDDVMLFLCMDEFEQEIYANPEKYTDHESLDALYTEIVSAYGNPEYFDLDYWHYVVFDYEAYFVSYAVSLIPCVELYYLAETDMDAAKQTYLSLIEYEGDLTFSEVLESAGLQNPLDPHYTVIDFETLLALMKQKQ